MPRLDPGPPADERYQGICRLVWRRPRSAASGPGPEPMRTPSSIMAMMLSPFIELRNATPAFFVASKTRARASTSTCGISARWTL